MIRYLISHRFQLWHKKIPQKSARQMLATFLKICESNRARRRRVTTLQRKIETALTLGPTSSAIAEGVRLPHRAGVRLPLRFTIGFIKGMAFLRQEKYAKYAPRDFAIDGLKIRQATGVARPIFIGPAARVSKLARN